MILIYELGYFICDFIIDDKTHKDIMIRIHKIITDWCLDDEGKICSIKTMMKRYLILNYIK